MLGPIQLHAEKLGIATVGLLLGMRNKSTTWWVDSAHLTGRLYHWALPMTKQHLLRVSAASTVMRAIDGS